MASVALAQGIEAADFEDDTYSAEGTAAHDLGARCLTSGKDAWEFIGEKTENGFTIDKKMADYVQTYADDVRTWHPGVNGTTLYSGIEHPFHCSTIHRLFYSTVDFWIVNPALRTLHVWDFKYGAGIAVDVPENPQCMYYACGILEDLGLWDHVDSVVLHIHQPRIEWHYEGTHRTWEIGVPALLDWLEDTLIPTLNDAEAVMKGKVSRDPKTGEHCRFCPVRFHFWKCSAVMADLMEMEALMKKAEDNGMSALNADEIGRLLTLGERFAPLKKAALATGTAIANAGLIVPGWKIAKAKANREFKDGAEEAAVKEFGKKRAFTEPKLKSPAQIEALPKGKDFTARWAFKPDKGETLVSVSDARPAVKKASVKDAFAEKAKERGKAA